MSGAGVTAVFAHPDDESLVAGATLAACAAAGHRVEVVCLTRGERGPGAHEGGLGARREAELRRACAALGVCDVVCLEHADGALAWSDRAALTADVAAVLHASAPRVVITFGPDGLYWHPDHIAVHEVVRTAYDLVPPATGAALYGATWPLGLADELADRMRARGLGARLWGLPPGAFGVAPDAITTTIDARAFTPAKLRALRRHRSQVVPGDLLHEIPADLAAELLGREHFVLLAGDGDPLPAMAAGLAGAAGGRSR